MPINRRNMVGRASAGLGALMLTGCDKLSNTTWFTKMLDSAESLNERLQPAVTSHGSHGRLYTEADLSEHFKSNGTHDPDTAEYNALAANDFVDWRLTLDGLVDHPMKLSLADLRAMPSVTQITRHDCVEGWSCIGKWTGVPLGDVLAGLGVQPRARYVMFFCYDRLGGSLSKYYESIDLTEAHHPQTLLAYEMNGETLKVPYGAPLRLRLGRQLGYKMAKYLERIQVVDSFADINGGNGGFYEDNGYEWYAGI